MIAFYSLLRRMLCLPRMWGRMTNMYFVKRVCRADRADHTGDHNRQSL